MALAQDGRKRGAGWLEGVGKAVDAPILAVVCQMAHGFGIAALVCSYWDQSKVEVNIAKQKNPLIGKIVSCARMVGPNAPGETCNIVIDHQGKTVVWCATYASTCPRGSNTWHTALTGGSILPRASAD